jgi:hypothetical protein
MTLFLPSKTESEYIVDEGLKIGANVGYLEVADPDKDAKITAVMLDVTDGVLKLGTAEPCQRTDIKVRSFTRCLFL